MVNEQDLVKRIVGGNRQAFGLLVQRYEKLVFHVVQRVVVDPQDVEDISQEVFVKIHRGLAGFAFEAKLSTWIARIAYLTAINYLKKYRRLPTEPLLPSQPLSADEEATPDQAAIQNDTSAYVHALILQLPEAYRTVLTLYHLEEFSIPEIETITGMPEGTIKSNLYRARKQLKEKLVSHLTNER